MQYHYCARRIQTFGDGMWMGQRIGEAAHFLRAYRKTKSLIHFIRYGNCQLFSCAYNLPLGRSGEDGLQVETESLLPEQQATSPQIAQFTVGPEPHPLIVGESILYFALGWKQFHK